MLDLVDDYYVCRGLVSLLLDKDLGYPMVQISCCVERTGAKPAYLATGNGMAKAVLSEVLEEMFGRSFVLDERPWRLEMEEAYVLARLGGYAKARAA